MLSILYSDYSYSITVADSSNKMKITRAWRNKTRDGGEIDQKKQATEGKLIYVIYAIL